MPEYKLQRFRGRWALAAYVGGRRISRRQLPALGATEAAAQFQQLVSEYERPARLTLAAIWDSYRQDRAGRPIAVTMGFERKAVLAHFGEMSAEEITDETCRTYTEKRRLQKRHDGTIWTELGHLRTALIWAQKTKRIAQAPHIERPPKPAPKERYLTREEAEQLLDAAVMPHVRLFIILAITTAARASALLQLTWDRIDFERGLIHLRDPNFIGRRKGRASVPMNSMARAALAGAKPGARSAYVIEWAGEKVLKVRKGIANAAKRAELAGVTPHVLRHTAAVWMAEAGRPMSEIAQYLGHEDSRITERVYARYSPGHLREASAALEFGKMRSAPGSFEPLVQLAERKKAS